MEVREGARAEGRESALPVFVARSCRSAARALAAPSFAVRDTGPETEWGRGGRAAGAAGAGWRSPALRPARPRVSAPCPGGVSERPGDAEETSTQAPAFQRKGQLVPHRRDFADAAI